MYEYEMTNKGAIGLHMLAQFNRVVTLDIGVKVLEFQERLCVDCSGFCQTLLDEYMLSQVDKERRKCQNYTRHY